MGILKKSFVLSKTNSDKVSPTAKYENMRANKLESHLCLISRG